MSEIILTDENFKEEVLKSEKPIVIDFWADWCVPCKMMAPILEKIAEDYQGKIKVCKAKMEDAQATAGMFGIEAIPTLLFFKQGKLIDKIVGVVSFETLDQKIKQIL